MSPNPGYRMKGLSCTNGKSMNRIRKLSEPLGQKPDTTIGRDQGVRQVEYRWKILEWLNGSREKVENLLWFFKH